MKLYIVKLSEQVPYIRVRDIANRIDSDSVITVIEHNKVYEFQSEKVADIVSRVLNGIVETVEYDINNLYMQV
jgi:hypothetical protein